MGGASSRPPPGFVDPMFRSGERATYTSQHGYTLHGLIVTHRDTGKGYRAYQFKQDKGPMRWAHAWELARVPGAGVPAPAAATTTTTVVVGGRTVAHHGVQQFVNPAPVLFGSMQRAPAHQPCTTTTTVGYAVTPQHAVPAPYYQPYVQAAVPYQVQAAYPYPAQAAPAPPPAAMPPQPYRQYPHQQPVPPYQPGAPAPPPQYPPSQQQPYPGQAAAAAAPPAYQREYAPPTTPRPAPYGRSSPPSSMKKS